MLWGEPATQQACLDALKTPDPRTGRADWTHGLVCVRRPLGSRNLADEVNTTVYPTDHVLPYEGAHPKYDEDCEGRRAAREAEEVPGDLPLRGLGIDLSRLTDYQRKLLHEMMSRDFHVGRSILVGADLAGHAAEEMVHLVHDEVILERKGEDPQVVDIVRSRKSYSPPAESPRKPKKSRRRRNNRRNRK